MNSYLIKSPVRRGARQLSYEKLPYVYMPQYTHSTLQRLKSPHARENLDPQLAKKNNSADQTGDVY